MYQDLAAPPDRSPVVPARRRTLWAAWCAGVATVLVIVALGAAAFVHVPYVIISPGDATPLDDSVLGVGGAPTYEHEGNLLFLTVAVSSRDPNLYRYVFARLDDDAAVERKEEIIGCAGYEASSRLARDQMAQSQDVAKAVALRRLGYEVPAEPGRVQVVDVLCGGPSEGRLELGDVIVAVDGSPVASPDEVRSAILARRPGERAVFSVERDGAPREVAVRLGRRDGAAFAGIVSFTDRRHRIPLRVEIDTARISGPSAGLAFSLAIIDDLTPGSLVGRRDVAVTGTILEDGTVGPVGGIAQKAVTARRAGVRLMIVPKGEEGDARARAGDMRVVGVRTLDEALAALAGAGGTPLPSAVPAGTAQ
jgi:PDZ domain-containing protein